jgi:probable F420-dependent oxidoreductase
MPRTELAIAIPQTFPGQPVRAALIRDHLLRAEALGFHSAWVVEHTLGAMTSLAPLEVLTYAAAITTRMKLGTAVLLTALHSPVHLAKSLATLDQLSGGRLIAGVGLGGTAAVYPAHGLSGERRAARFAEGVRLMTRLWTEPRVTFAGEFYRVTDAVVEPRPFQTPHPPIWFGAHHPNALRRAVELGQGFMGAGSGSTARFAGEVKALRAMLSDAGRDPEAFPIGKRVYLAIDADKARAGRRLAEWFQGFYGRSQLAEEVSVWGSEDECAERLAEVASAGAGLLLLNPVFDEMEHLERIAAALRPRLS